MIATTLLEWSDGSLTIEWRILVGLGIGLVLKWMIHR